MDGEITEEEYESAIEQFTVAESMADEIEKMKAQKYSKAKEKYANDELTGEELEQKMDELMESGDDFLNHDPNEVEKEKKKEDTYLFFKNIFQIVAFVSVLVGCVLLIMFTAGRIIPLLVFLGFAYAIIKITMD